jgi:hypothetical protein
MSKRSLLKSDKPNFEDYYKKMQEVEISTGRDLPPTNLKNQRPVAVESKRSQPTSIHAEDLHEIIP